jgi:hypothetical protein
MTESTRNCFDRMAGESDKGANADQTVVSSERKVTDMKKSKERLRERIRNKPKVRKTFNKNKKAGAERPLPEDDNRPIAQTNDPNMEVMSHVILDFAEPLLKTCNDEASQRKAISLGIYVWNTAMLPEPECRRILATYLAGCQEVMPPEEFETLSGYIDRLVQTRKTRFADNHNKITNCTFGDFGTGRNIEVGYTLE